MLRNVLTRSKYVHSFYLIIVLLSLSKDSRFLEAIIASNQFHGLSPEKARRCNACADRAQWSGVQGRGGAGRGGAGRGGAGRGGAGRGGAGRGGAGVERVGRDT